MQEHLGNYFKKIIINQGLTIKDFATKYGTTATHMSTILSKKDFNTLIIRKIEILLNTDFKLIQSMELNEQSNINQSSINKGKTGRPVSMGKNLENQENHQTLLVVKDVEIKGLRQLLESKDELIKSKDQFINQLITSKN